MLEIYNYQEIVAKAKAFFVMCDPVDEETIHNYFGFDPKFIPVKNEMYAVDNLRMSDYEDKWFENCIFVGDFTGIDLKKCIFESCYFSGFASDILELAEETVLFIGCLIDFTHHKVPTSRYEMRVHSSGYING